MAGILFLYYLSLTTSRSRRFGHEPELKEKLAKLEGSEALNFGNHPKQNLVKSGGTVEDQRRWECEFLSKKYEECAKRRGSDEPTCGVLKKGWLRDCATLDGMPKQVFEGERRHR